jgi:DNA polymerase elongation subunit (family B)
MNITESKLKSCLFFDIETCGNYENFEQLKRSDAVGAHIWEKKCQRMGYGSPEEGYTNKVSLFPEFGRIVCLSYGIWKNGELVINTIMEEDNNTMLKYISNLFHKAGANGLVPTGWNIKNFDIPWVQRKLVMHGISVPMAISAFEKKPWEVNIFDMKEMWKSFSNLDVTFEEAAYAMGIPTPKDDIDGSQVHGEFWKGNSERIKTYCEKDVKTMILMAEKLFTINNPKVLA